MTRKEYYQSNRRKILLEHYFVKCGFVSDETCNVSQAPYWAPKNVGMKRRLCTLVEDYAKYLVI